MKEPKKNKGILVSLFIAFIMITSVIGYMMADSSTNTVKFKDHKFTQSPEGWILFLEGNKYVFSYLPEQLENIDIPLDSNIKEIDTTYDLNSTYAEKTAEAIFKLDQIGQQNGLYIVNGFTTNYSSNFPIITCENANNFAPVIYYKIGDSNNVTKNGNCIIIESNNGNEFMPATEKIAYKILGIMD